jgi:hypothetical protein
MFITLPRSAFLIVDDLEGGEEIERRRYGGDID